MRVRTKLIAITLFVAVVPLMVSTFQSLSIHDKALQGALVQLHANTAQSGARTVDQYLENLRSSLHTIVRETINWETLTPEETQGALWLIYGQFDSAQIVEMTEGDDRTAAFLAVSSKERPRRRPLSASARSQFQQSLPQPTVEGALGTLIDSERGSPLLPMAMLDSTGSRSISVGLDVHPLCARIARLRPLDGEIELFSPNGRRVCSSRRGGLSAPVPKDLRKILTSSASHYERGALNSEPMRGATARSRDSWHITVEQPKSVITAPTIALRNQSILWVIVGAMAALVSGLILSREIHGPLEELTLGAQEIGGGNLEFRLAETSEDEFGLLSRAFNKMSQEIATRDWEIHFWNEQLQQRVEERSEQLEKANRALLRSRKIAGLSTLAAGISHEMNNPLTGILGLAQVLLVRLKKNPDNHNSVPLLESVVHESLRMQRLLQKMMTLNEPTDDSDFQSVALEPLLKGVRLAESEHIEQRKARLTLNHTDGALNALGDPKLLAQLLQEVLNNALKSLPDVGGEIQISTRGEGDDWVQILVKDNGHGIRPETLGRILEPFFTTKPGGEGEGLGLARAHQLVELHSGTLEIRSEWQGGTEVEITLPAVRAEAHLV